MLELLSRWFLRQRRRIAIRRQVTKGLVTHRRALWHVWLVRHMRGILGELMRRHLRRQGHMLNCVLGWSMVRWKGIIRSLPHHTIAISVAGIRGLGHWRRRRRLIATIGQMRRCHLGTSLWWAITTIRYRRGRHCVHAIRRHEGLGLGIETMTLVAARNRMLALWVVRIDICWELAVRIWYSWCSRCSPGLIRALIEAWLLPPLLLRTVLNWLDITLHRTTWSLSLIPRWSGLLRILIELVNT